MINNTLSSICECKLHIFFYNPNNLYARTRIARTRIFYFEMSKYTTFAISLNVFSSARDTRAFGLSRGQRRQGQMPGHTTRCPGICASRSRSRSALAISRKGKDFQHTNPTMPTQVPRLVHTSGTIRLITKEGFHGKLKNLDNL